MIPIQTAAQFQTRPSVSGLQLHASVLQILEAEPPQAAQIVAVNAVWRKLLLQAEMVAPHVQVAAIEGEKGVGKETLARHLHGSSPLARSDFQRRDARGWLATGGDPSTLQGFIYLLRVDLLATSDQVLLLGVLKALQDLPPGRAVLLASSESSLRLLAGQGILIPDLAFRLTAVCFAVPPLRQRREDIAPLALALLNRARARCQLRPAALGPGALARLLQHNWPGNVRELACVMEAALLEAVNGIIRAEDLPIISEIVQQPEPQPAGCTENLALDEFVRRHVQYVLDLNHGNKLRAARQLGISRSTIYRILESAAILAHSTHQPA